MTHDKLIEALKNQEQWYKQNGGGWPDDDHAIIYLAAKSTLATPDTQGALEAITLIDELDADQDYLFGRVAVDGSCAGLMANAVRSKLAIIRTALTRPSREAKLLDALKAVIESPQVRSDLHPDRLKLAKQAIAEAEGE